MRIHELYDNQDGTFIGINLGQKSAERLNKWCKESLIPNQLPIEELHCTLIYSKDNLPPNIEIQKYSDMLKVEPDTYEYALFGENGNTLVLKITQEKIQDRWYELKKKYKFQYDFPTYIPHISLSYDIPQGFNINRLEKPNFPIYFIGEYRESLKNDDIDECAGVGKIVNGVNSTVDVKQGEIKRQAAKFGNDVTPDGVPLLSLYDAHKKIKKR
jgi:hypothetical protein